MAPSRRRLALVFGALTLGAGAALAFSLGTLEDGLVTPRPSRLLLDRHERTVGELESPDGEFGYWPLPDVLPDKVVQATLETEDRHFYDHDGVYWPSVLRAVKQNVANRRKVSGASTIAMQLARLEHPRPRTLWAKLHEALEARRLIARHGHDLVLRQYLVLAPYGNRAHGIVRAARLYFDKPVEDLSWLQAAFLAALPQQPGRMSPWHSDGRARALKRAHRILTQLYARGIIDDEAWRVAMASDLSLAPKPRRAEESLHALLAWAPRMTGDAVIFRATLDLELQKLTHQALTRNLELLRPLDAGNTCGVVIDLPTGEILAYVGSAAYDDAEHRGAIDYLQARRSPGSALKPFIYALALEQRTHTAASEVPDTPVEFDVPGGGQYVPENITHTWLGPMLLRQALGNSRNIPALRVLSELGVDRVVERLEQGGVQQIDHRPDAYGLTLAIGSLHVTPLELAELYTALANQGREVPLRHFLDEQAPPGPQLFTREAAMLTAHILADPEARRPGFPSGSPLDFDYAVSVKTGTSQGYRDAWAAGFSDRLLVVTWVGNHDWRRMHLASGATAAAPAMHHVMDTAMPTRAPERPVANEAPLPEGLVTRDVCALSGRLPGKGCTHLRHEVFIAGTEPTAECPFHVDVAIDTRNGLRAGPSCPASAVIKRPMLALPSVYETWARKQHLTLAPFAESPLCPAVEPAPKIVIREPKAQARYLYDPDTPREFSTVRFAATVTPATSELVWLVDGTPVAKVPYPHELRWPLTPGVHTIKAALAGTHVVSAAVTVVVDD